MTRLFIILTAYILLSCDSDEVLPEARLDPFITIEADNGYFGQVFYFATTLEGELLGYVEIESRKINTLNSDSSLFPEKYNVHRLYISDNSNVKRLESFFNTSKNHFVEKDNCDDPYVSLGNCNIQISGPTYQNFLISAPTQGAGNSSLNETFNIEENIDTELYQDHNFLFTFLKRNQKYYYEYFFDLSPNENYWFELNPNTMNTDYEMKLLDAPEGMIFLDDGNIQSVILSKKCFSSRYNLFSERSMENNNLSVFTTPIDHVKYYTCLFNLSVDNKKEYTYITEGSIPDLIPQLEFDITNSNLEINNLSITPTGKYDAILGDFRGEVSSLKNWIFYSDNPNTIKFPEFPSEILKIYPSLTGTGFFETSNVISKVSLYDHSEITNYLDFINQLELRSDFDHKMELKILTVKNH